MTKYNKAEIMRRAHSIRREGKSLSESMTIAWAEAKISRLDTLMFNLNMKDRWTQEEREANSKWSLERTALKAKAGIVEKPEATTRPAAPKLIENPALTAEEKREIKMQMTTMWLNMATFNMAEYKALEARLYVAA